MNRATRSFEKVVARELVIVCLWVVIPQAEDTLAHFGRDVGFSEYPGIPVF